MSRHPHRIPFARADARAAGFLEDLSGACVMESTFREHMAERDLLFHDTVAPHLAAYAPEASAAQQRDYLTHEWERMKYEGRMMKWGSGSGAFSSFIIHPSTLGSAPSHPIRNRLLRLTADSPNLLAIIKQEGKV
jgi:adenine-specific DNA-methyltransferase